MNTTNQNNPITKNQRRALIAQRYAALCGALAIGSRFTDEDTTHRLIHDTRSATLSAENFGSEDLPSEEGRAEFPLDLAEDTRPRGLAANDAPLSKAEKRRLTVEVDAARWQASRARNLWIVLV